MKIEFVIERWYEEECHFHLTGYAMRADGHWLQGDIYIIYQTSPIAQFMDGHDRMDYQLGGKGLVLCDFYRTDASPRRLLSRVRDSMSRWTKAARSGQQMSPWFGRLLPQAADMVTCRKLWSQRLRIELPTSLNKKILYDPNHVQGLRVIGNCSRLKKEITTHYSRPFGQHDGESETTPPFA